MVLSGARIEGSAWASDSRNLVFSGTVNGKEGLWRIGASGPKSPEKLNGIGSSIPRSKRMGRSRGVTVAVTCGRLVYSQSIFDSNLWRMAMTGTAKGKTAQFISSTRDEIQPDYSSDGRKIAFENQTARDRKNFGSATRIGPLRCK